MDYRKLTKQEIDSLKGQNCFSENWETVQVKENFLPERIQNVRFAGTVRLGTFTESIETEKEIIKPCGLYNSYLQNCTIDDNVLISDVKTLANYHIENNVVIENVASLVVSGQTTFGNGVEIEILNEGGGRELPIFDKLSSQIAYLMVIYRHDKEFINKLGKIISSYVETKKSTQGIIHQGSRILNCQKIENVAIGAKATIAGALHLENGTIASTESDPTFIGEGVIAKSFIIQSGSKVDGAAMLHSSFVGQGVQIGKQYSAENSAFFANSEGFHGEACSVFAGPYTVTHHKSTLLIAGLFSFYNAGSGSNQSNHMYKVGPVHQGILERGAKTGSFSYMMWPAKIGAFSGVIGKHYANVDTSDLPFSYILESNGKSLLMPAMNLFTVGTKRDSEKWPNRDRRKYPQKLDLLNFELFSPYTTGKIVLGIEVLKNLDKSENQNGYVKYNGTSIKQTKIQAGIEGYETAIKIFIGNELFKQLKDVSEKTTFDDFRKMITPKISTGNGSWVDLSGMLAPFSEIEKMMSAIRKENIRSIAKLSDELKSIHENYNKYAWNWCAGLIEKRTKKRIGDLSPKRITQLIVDWKNSSIKFNDLVLKDAEKEFSAKSQIGYGIDGGDDVKAKDFKAVRGSFDENKFVAQIKEESKLIQTKAKSLILLLEKIK